MQKDKNGEPVKVRRKKKSYVEIALINELAEDETVRLRLEKGYEKKVRIEGTLELKTKSDLS